MSLDLAKAPTTLSVNLNKIALLRNSRGRNFPSVLDFAQQAVDAGAKSLTIHPRPDERHIRAQDAKDLSQFVARYDGLELNIEGFPSEGFIELIEASRPHQVTLVPDTDDQLTSDHGWNLDGNLADLKRVCQRLAPFAGRVALFVDPGAELKKLKGVVDRVELYTEAYAKAFSLLQSKGALIDSFALDHALKPYQMTLEAAYDLDIGVNAGHDLDLNNLARFLKIGPVLEVSIGHALTVEALQYTWPGAIARYLDICRQA